MGIVLRARDTRLDRDVALKVLPEAFTTGPDRLAPFEREAKVLASLNHPNIGSIYGLEESDGIRALVLELVEGPTLADRIKQGPIPVDEALPIATQIAEALEAAHAQGVIHRDLKPANVKVKDDGTVKVLDFGLAKAFQPEAADPDMSLSPTISLTAAATQMGMVIGTAAYMSPEQAKGKPVTRQADVWAFGVVLYEMLTGTRVFSGEDVTDTIAGMFETGVAARSKPTPATRLRVWQRPVPAAVVGVALLALGGLAVWTLTPDTTGDLMRFAIAPPAAAPLSVDGQERDLTISSDGAQILYNGVLLGGDVSQISLRPIDQVDGAPLRGAERGHAPFILPDGEWVGFVARCGRALRKVSIFGGTPVPLAESPFRILGATWGADDQIIFGTLFGGLFRVKGAGGEAELLTTPDPEQGEFSHL